HEWMESFKAQKRMAELGLKSEDELQSWFMKQMDDFLTSKGRKLIGWDEILEEGLASGAAVMSWRNADGGLKAAEAGHDAVMSVAEYTYFDSYQNEPVKNEPLAIGGMLPMEKVLEFNPIPDNLSEDKKNKILGGQGQLWTEYIANYKHLEYMAFPRVCALSEILWKNSNKILESEFKEHLNIHLQRLDALDVNYKVHEKAFRTMSI
ncbi:MAG: family 20 glycosylhydrolase, partial [Verrucomicrobiota bacterium]|nr:family 20 glycosylhydrolase [Verrucomicrobiota bacterium]